MKCCDMDGFWPKKIQGQTPHRQQSAGESDGRGSRRKVEMSNGGFRAWRGRSNHPARSAPINVSVSSSKLRIYLPDSSLSISSFSDLNLCQNLHPEKTGIVPPRVPPSHAETSKKRRPKIGTSLCCRHTSTKYLHLFHLEPAPSPRLTCGIGSAAAARSTGSRKAGRA